MNSRPLDPAQHIRKLEAEVGRLQQEVERLQAMLGLRAASDTRNLPTADAAQAVPTQPLRIQGQPGNADAVVTDAPRVTSTSAARILVVDDSEDSLKIALLLVESLGHSAEGVSTGLEAIRALEQRRFNLVLMDMLMPIMDGLETTRRICARWPREQRPRIVAMTGLTADADHKACLAAGADGYISKPLTRQVLADTLAGSGFSTIAEAPFSPPVATTPTIVHPPASAFLDTQILNQWAQSSRTAAVGIVDVFLKGMPKMLAELRATADTTDVKTFQRAAHSLKSASVAVGAVAMATLAAELEALGRAGTIRGTREAVARLEAMRAPLEEKLQELRKLYA